jgi:hypothetical protein
LLAFALLGGTTAQADDPFRLTSAGSTVSNGVYVGPYGGVLGSGPGAPSIDVVCVDYFNNAQLNQTYTVRTTTLSDAGFDPNAVRFGNTGGLLAYRQAAWLSWQFASTPPSSWGTIHRTIWNIFTPVPRTSSPPGSPCRRRGTSGTRRRAGPTELRRRADRCQRGRQHRSAVGRVHHPTPEPATLPYQHRPGLRARPGGQARRHVR